jgi:hypothetical protein
VKKKVVFGGRLESLPGETVLSLVVGPKFDLRALLQAAGGDLQAGDWRAEVIRVETPGDQATPRQGNSLPHGDVVRISQCDSVRRE